MTPANAERLTAPPAPLLGKRLLVVEDDYLLASGLCRGLVDLGATVLGPAPTPFYALGLLGRRGVDAAILDVRLHGTDVFSVADVLMARNIPMIFATALPATDLPPQYRGFPVVPKPVDTQHLLPLLEHALLLRKTKILDPENVASPREPDDHRLMRAVVQALRLARPSRSI